MALSSGGVWEVRVSGNDLNGGFFNPDRGGVDYSQQDAAQVVFTDLVIDAVNSTKVTSAANPFTSDHKGNSLRLIGGGGFNAGLFEILDVASNVATLDRSAGTTGSTGGQGRLGGALASLSLATSGFVAGNKIYIRDDGEHALTGTIRLTTRGSLDKANEIEGYATTRGDGGRARLFASLASLNEILYLPGMSPPNHSAQYWILRNLSLSGFAKDVTKIGVRADGYYVYLENVWVTNCSGGIVVGDEPVGTTLEARDCFAYGNHRGWIFQQTSTSFPKAHLLERCGASGNTDAGFLLRGGAPILIECFAIGNGTDGITVTQRQGLYLLHSDIYRNTRDGLRYSGTDAPIFVVEWNIFEENGGYGIRSTSIDFSIRDTGYSFRENAFFGNASGETHFVPSSGAIELVRGAFTYPPTGDFSISLIDGSGSVIASRPGSVSFLGLPASSGCLDLGAVPSTGFFQLEAPEPPSLPTPAPTGFILVIEDSDGIPPTEGTSGTATCDLTPTFTWAATGGMIYHWRIRHNGGALIASGSVVGIAQVTSPPLSADVYTICVDGIDSDGAVFNIPCQTITIRDCTPDALKIPLIEISPFDLDQMEEEEPVTGVEEYLRYLPQWLACYGTADAPPSGSTLYRFFVPWLRDLRRASIEATTLLDEASIESAPVRQPRLGWALQTRFTHRDTLTAVVSASGIVTDLRRAFSMFDFLNTSHPVFMVDDQGLAVFRNLSQRIVEVRPQNEFFVSGSIDNTVYENLRHQYVMPADRIVRDTDLFFLYQGKEFRIRAGARGIDPDKGIVQLTPEFSGAIVFRYQSRLYLPTIQVSVSGQPFLVPSRVDFPNRFDELGLLVGLSRRPNEDNLLFKERLLARFHSQLGTGRVPVASRVAQDLVLVERVGWGGRSTLSFTTSGYFGIRQVDVAELPPWETRTERLSADGLTRYSAGKGDWLPGWFVTVDGVPTSPERFPTMTLSGNILHLGREVSGTVVATYRYENYRLTRSAAGFVTGLVPVAMNCPSGAYDLILTRNVRVHTAGDPEYQESDLLNADGTPNGYFHEIKERVLEDSPVNLSRARWGRSAYWTRENEEKPQIEHLPAVFDLIAGL